MDHAPVGLFVIDSQDHVTSWNKAAGRLLGLATTDTVGRRFRDLDVSYRVPGLRRAVEAMKATSASEPMRLPGTIVPCAGDTSVCIDFTLTPGPGDRPRSVWVWAEDVTARAALERRIAGLQADLKQATARITDGERDLRDQGESHATEQEQLLTVNEELRTINESLTSAPARPAAATLSFVEPHEARARLDGQIADLQRQVEELMAKGQRREAISASLEASRRALARTSFAIQRSHQRLRLSFLRLHAVAAQRRPRKGC